MPKFLERAELTAATEAALRRSPVAVLLGLRRITLPGHSGRR